MEWIGKSPGWQKWKKNVNENVNKYKHRIRWNY